MSSLAAHDRSQGLLEELTEATMRLARRNEALEDFAALVAHELRTPLQAALRADDPSTMLEEALELIDALLETGRGPTANAGFASAGPSVERTAAAYPDRGLELTADVRTLLPISETALSVIARNLLRNAVAAGAQHVHVSTSRSGGLWRLDVDDDGAGPGSGSYASGCGLGLKLCRRIAAQFGAVLELAPRPFGGARASLVFAEGDQ